MPIKQLLRLETTEDGKAWLWQSHLENAKVKITI